LLKGRAATRLVRYKTSEAHGKMRLAATSQ
jgi:hypothetical protein